MYSSYSHLFYLCIYFSHLQFKMNMSRVGINVLNENDSFEEKNLFIILDA